MYCKLGQDCVTNWGSFVYYELGKTLSQIGAASLLQIRASIVTNWGSCYKLEQLLQIGAKCITNWGSYYKLGQLLQIGAQHLPKKSLFTLKIVRALTNF